MAFSGGEVTDFSTGIDADFMQEVLRRVGNYDEVYRRNIEPLGLPREGTLNDSWLNGGLIYAPPIASAARGGRSGRAVLARRAARR